MRWLAGANLSAQQCPSGEMPALGRNRTSGSPGSEMTALQRLSTLGLSDVLTLTATKQPFGPVTAAVSNGRCLSAAVVANQQATRGTYGP